MPTSSHLMSCSCCSPTSAPGLAKNVLETMNIYRQSQTGTSSILLSGNNPRQCTRRGITLCIVTNKVDTYQPQQLSMYIRASLLNARTRPEERHPPDAAAVTIATHARTHSRTHARRVASTFLQRNRTCSAEKTQVSLDVYRRDEVMRMNKWNKY